MQPCMQSAACVFAFSCRGTRLAIISVSPGERKKDTNRTAGFSLERQVKDVYSGIKGRAGAYRIAGLHLKDRPRAARVALYTPKLSRKPRTVAMIMNADTAKRFSLHIRMAVNSPVGMRKYLCHILTRCKIPRRWGVEGKCRCYRPKEACLRGGTL